MELANKRIDDARTILVSRSGQLGVARGGDGAGVAKQRLDVTKAQAAFKQVCGETVAIMGSSP